VLGQPAVRLLFVDTDEAVRLHHDRCAVTAGLAGFKLVEEWPGAELGHGELVCALDGGTKRCLQVMTSGS